MIGLTVSFFALKLDALLQSAYYIVHRLRLGASRYPGPKYRRVLSHSQMECTRGLGL